MKIEIVEGDITGVSADALVNAANNHLWMGAGVAGAIKKAGGTDIEDEAVRKGPIAVGTVVETGAGRLPVKFIIHAAVMGQDLHTGAMIIEHSTINSLRKAEELGLKSIAFPALGTGIGGFSLEECAQIMIHAALEYKGINKLEKLFLFSTNIPATGYLQPNSPDKQEVSLNGLRSVQAFFIAPSTR